jgi:hypothetical protein
MRQLQQQLCKPGRDLAQHPPPLPTHQTRSNSNFHLVQASSFHMVHAMLLALFLLMSPTPLTQTHNNAVPRDTLADCCLARIRPKQQTACGIQGSAHMPSHHWPLLAHSSPQDDQTTSQISVVHHKVRAVCCLAMLEPVLKSACAIQGLHTDIPTNAITPLATQCLEHSSSHYA